ncbi:MAG TPA: hypothetical protein VK507_10435 [Iamia sp.]|nr:hypothetical protein [Iamia sp.]
MTVTATMPPPPAPPPAPPKAPAGATVNPAAWGRHPLVRIPTLAFGGLVVLVLLSACAFSVANLLVRTTEIDSTTLTGEVRRADVHVTGSVTITTGPVDQVEISRRSTFGVSHPRVRETLVDGLLTVRVECVGGFSVICTNDVDLVVPADVSFSIDALGTHIADVQGDVELNSGAGSVELERLSGDLEIAVGGGSISGLDLRSSRVRASAGAGSVELDFLVAPDDVDANSGAGSVLVRLPQGDEAYRVDADAGAGSDVVTVKTDQTSERRIRANAGAGSAEVHYQP